MFLGIDSIKNQLKDNTARLKREKTAIIGDVKPMMDILAMTSNKKPAEKKKSVSFKLTNSNFEAKKQSQPSTDNTFSKKEQREKNLERENSKPIQKQSIRFKKAYAI